MKVCGDCGVAKPRKDFNKRTASRDGLQSRCRACQAVRKFKWDADTEYGKQWRRSNADTLAAYMKDWRSQPEVRERERARLAQWAKDHPDRRCANEAKRRAAKRTLDAEYVHPLLVLEMHDGVCGICHGDVDPLCFDLDHKVPLALGGPHTYENVQPAHPRCNQSKGAKVVV